VTRLRRIVPEAALGQVLAGLCSDRAVSFRVNTLRVTREPVLERLRSAGLDWAPVDWFSDAGVLEPGRLAELQAALPHAVSEIFVQGLSSMTAPLALAPQPGERVLDMCAAPGGKSTLLAALMGGPVDPGRLHANDSSRSRLYKLRAVLEQQGAHAVTTSARQGQSFGRTHAGVFDAVLVDAPCSAEARLHPESQERWTARRIPRLAGLQTRLLESAVRATRPGGRIVYATCTFAPEENEAVVDRVLERCEGTLSLEKLELPLPASLPGLTGWGRKTFRPELCRARRLIPAPGVEGFFLALLRRA
jgi:16S rRNA (cytosine1407-C5)-methyltransferase